MIPSESIPKVENQPIEVFFSYAHEDEGLRDQLANHLKLLQRQKVITAWYDRQITAGTEWAGQIDRHLQEARIILLLISADFLASDYCYDVELKRAMERHESGEARVIPIILRSVDWRGAEFGKLNALPKDGKPVTSFRDLDEAFTDIAKGIRRVVGELTATSPVAARKSISMNPIQQKKREELTDLLNSLLNLWTTGTRELKTMRDGVDRQYKKQQIDDLDREMKEVQKQLNDLDNPSC